MQKYEVVITQQAGEIDCNFEAAKRYLASRLEEYNGVIFTEDKKKEAKSAVAGLRKEQKAFADRVKEVKKEYMKPFEAFFAKATELMDMYDKPIAYINEQIDAYEKKRIEERKADITRWYAELIGDFGEILPLERIYNPKWENATTSKNAICKEIVERKVAARDALSAIQAMKSDVEEKAILIYRNTYDLSKAMLCISQYEAQKAEIQRREQEKVLQKERERIRKEEQEKLEVERMHREEILTLQREKEDAMFLAEEEKQAAVQMAKEEAAQEVIDSLIAKTESRTRTYRYCLKLSIEQKEKFEMYLDSIGIEWEMI